MNISTLQEEIHANAAAKGWWEEERTPLEIHMLCVSEIAEATEAVRDGLDHYFEDSKGKPEGEAVELADCIIRILDYAEHKYWDMSEIIQKKLDYNKTRAHRHGGKKY